jgi:phospholipase/carboxylesterase
VRALPRFVAAREIIAARRKEGFARFRQAADGAKPLLVWPDGGPGKVKAILVALHGSGGTGKEVADAWKSVATKYHALLIAPDALRPAGNGYSWVFMDEGEWWVLENVRRAREQWHLPDTPVILTGYSQGANLALRVGTLHPDVFHGVIVVNGHYEAHLVPVPRDAKAAPRFYLLAGEEDRAVGTLRDAAAVFKKAGMRVKLQTLPGGHQFPRSDAELARAMDFALSGK